MRFYSTHSPTISVSIPQALFQSMPADGGLYMPDRMPVLGADFFDRIATQSLADIGFSIAQQLFKNDLSDKALEQITHQALNFETPIVALSEGRLYVQELFHGPSLAFKDVGARFMAAMMSHYAHDRGAEIHILVATSGDTGGAVAMGFHQVPGVRVSILYPKGRVSFLQEQQLTTLGGNVQAFEVEGSFDDCQAMAKRAFIDVELNQQVTLSSANSINIFRLIPQGFYYVSAYGQVKSWQKPVVFSTPSGNFGNLSAGVLMQRLGLPIRHFVAATNLNRTVPDFLDTGTYTPRTSISTISNAMDVGSPSNFVRLEKLYNSDYKLITDNITGYVFDDEQTRIGMKRIDTEFGYVACPHTTIGVLGLQHYLQESVNDAVGIALSTAHPAKFKPLVEETLGHPITVPDRLAKLAHLKKQAIVIPAQYEAFKAAFLETV